MRDSLAEATPRLKATFRCDQLPQVDHSRCNGRQSARLASHVMHLRHDLELHIGSSQTFALDAQDKSSHTGCLTLQRRIHGTAKLIVGGKWNPGRSIE